MTIEQLLTALQNAECDIAITHDGSYRYGSKEWTVRINKSGSGISFSLTVTKERLDEALSVAWNRYDTSVRSGMPELTVAIEHHTDNEDNHND